MARIVTPNTLSQVQSHYKIINSSIVTPKFINSSVTHLSWQVQSHLLQIKNLKINYYTIILTRRNKFVTKYYLFVVKKQGVNHYDKSWILHSNMSAQIKKSIVIKPISPHEFIKITLQSSSPTALMLIIFFRIFKLIII